MKRLWVRVLPLVPVVLGSFATPFAAAISLQFANGVNSTATDSIASCSNPTYAQAYTGCVTNAFIDTNVADMSSQFMDLSSFGGGGQSLGEENFITAFNTSMPGWKLVQGTGLDNITLTVSGFSADSEATVGGIDNVTVNVTGTLNAGDPTTDQLVWIQGLEINYQPGTDYSTATNFNTLDDYTFNNFSQAGGCTAIPASPNGTTPSNITGGSYYCDPIYPFQNGDLHFFDGPMGPWPNGSFRGIALLATVNTVTDTVTVYGGVDYGFDNSVVPEPGTRLLLLSSIGMLGLIRRRYSARKPRVN